MPVADTELLFALNPQDKKHGEQQFIHQASRN